MKIGIVDLDTSHPEAWIPLERALGHEILGVWDGGSVHPPGYAQTFAKDHGIPQIYRTLEEMASHVDCAILHGCNWDTHVEKAAPFIQAGKSVLLDKPMAGNLRDLQIIQDWTDKGARITGGSSLRFCREIQDWLLLPVDERGLPFNVWCGCGVDDFNYGIHAYSALCAIMGPGLRSVRHLSGGNQHRIELAWPDERYGYVLVGSLKSWIPTYATIVTDRRVFHLEPDTSNLYAHQLKCLLPFLAGDLLSPPLPFSHLAEAELAAIAALQSRKSGNREVLLADLDPCCGYSGDEFAHHYREARRAQD